MMKKEQSDLRIRSGTPASIRESLKKATTEMLVLFSLQKEPMYTYQIAQHLEELSEGGITFNTLYPAIYRLQGFGYVAEEKTVTVDNRTRVYFTVTQAGRDYLKRLIEEYQGFTGAVDRILGLGGRPSGGDTHESI